MPHRQPTRMRLHLRQNELIYLLYEKGMPGARARLRCAVSKISCIGNPGVHDHYHWAARQSGGTGISLRLVTSFIGVVLRIFLKSISSGSTSPPRMLKQEKSLRETLERAAAQKQLMHGVLCDVCTGRFYDFVEKRSGKWGSV
jgi:hypothetical protein